MKATKYVFHTYAGFDWEHGGDADGSIFLRQAYLEGARRLAISINANGEFCVGLDVSASVDDKDVAPCNTGLRHVPGQQRVNQEHILGLTVEAVRAVMPSADVGTDVLIGNGDDLAAPLQL